MMFYSPTNFVHECGTSATLSRIALRKELNANQKETSKTYNIGEANPTDARNGFK